MPEVEKDFDFNEALKAIQEGKPLLGKEGILSPLIKKLTEADLEVELDSHFGQESAPTVAMKKSKSIT